VLGFFATELDFGREKSEHVNGPKMEKIEVKRSAFLEFSLS